MGGRRLRLLPLLSVAAALSLAGAGPLAAASNESARQVAGDYIVVFRPGVTRPLQLTRALERARGFASFRQFGLLGGFSARLTHAQLAALRAHPSVAFVDQDRVFHAAGTEALASGERVPTGVRRMQATQHGHMRGPSAVNVAVLDTGLDLSHPDLNAVHGTNCIGSGIAYDDRGHGTAVAGTIAASNNGSGIVGVAPGTRVVAVKVLDSKFEGTTSSLICGVEWVTSTLTDADPDNDILVANMSLYSHTSPIQDCAVTTDSLHRAICASTAAGVTYVVSAGNTAKPFDDPARQAIVPAAYPEVLTATAMADSDGKPGGLAEPPKCKTTETDDHVAIFSSYAVTEVGRSHTIAAPGVCVRAISPGGRGYWIGYGTSLTAPHVAGAVALCINDGGTPGPCAGLTPAEVIQKMRADAEASTTSDPGFGFAGDPSRPTDGRYYGYLVRVGVDAPPSEARPPSSATIRKGVRVRGGYRRLAADDDAYFSVRSTNRATRATTWIGRFTGVPRDATSLTLRYAGLNSRECTQVISIRRFAKPGWVTLESRPVGPSETLIELAIAGPASAFISGTAATGELWVRVACRTTAGKFYASADLMQLELARP